jgi:signal transduction histidine kinase
MGRTEVIILLVVATAAFFALVTGFLVFVFQFRNKTMRYNSERELEAEQHRQHLLSAQLEMQAQTMEHIGREIHDNVGQKLTLAALHAQQLEYKNQYPAIERTLAGISSLINESLAELRSLSKNLTDNHLLAIDLQDLLERECDKMNALGSCQVVASFTGPSVRASLLVKTIVLRLFQEFMQNSLKHAACTTITVQLVSEDTGLRLSVADDGKGFDLASANNRGIGLQNMSKRAAMIGADLLLESKLGEGTKLFLFIPDNKLNQ